MYYFFNTLIHLSSYIFFTLSIIGYGIFFRNNFIKINFNFGEIGILGFFALYLISVVSNFFFPINIYLSLTILLLGLIFFLINYKKLLIINKKFILISFILFYLSSVTINLHDDHFLYQLTYINYKQEFKIIFGLVSLNDFLAYSHGFYDTMALFKIPIYGNSLVFLLPVIFFMFVIFVVIENYDKKQNILSNLIIFIVLLTLFKFTRTKEFGTDIPVIGLLFLIQIYFLSYFFTKDKIFFFKMLLTFSLAVMFKIYAVIAIFYFLIFVKKFKFLFFELFTRKKIIFIFLCFASLVTISKNIIQSGCLIYPVTSTCFDKKVLSWSSGKELSSWRKEFLEAGVKGWMPYVRENNFKEKIFPKEYNLKFKYDFHKNVIKDPDLERIFLVLIILAITILVSFLSKEKNLKIDKPIQYNFYLVISLIPLVLWFLLMPYIRYGGYAYLPFGLFFIFYYFSYKSFILSKTLKILLIFGLIYFSSKNILRINQEVKSLDKFSIDHVKTKDTYPIPSFQYIGVEKKKYAKYPIYVSKHNWVCGIIFFPCIPGYWENMELKIQNRFGYLFIFVNENDYINILESKMKKYYLKEDRYGDDFNINIRPN